MTAKIEGLPDKYLGEITADFWKRNFDNCRVVHYLRPVVAKARRQRKIGIGQRQVLKK